MYNQEIYDKLQEKFGAFNMPVICKGIAEYFRVQAESTDTKFNQLADGYEADWWTSAVEQANKSINENDW